MANEIPDDDETTLCFTRYIPRTCTLTWKIHGFEQKVKIGEKMVSDTFQHSLEKDRKFTVTCYPKGKSEDASGYISLFLSMNSTQKNVLVDAEFSLIDKNEQVVKTASMQRCFSTGTRWGYITYFPINQLKDVLWDECLVVRCVVTTYSKKTVCSRVTKRQDFNLARYEALSGDFKKLFREQSFSDVVIKLDGLEFKCCWNILSARSSISIVKDKDDTKTYRIPDMNRTNCEILLRYLYAAELPELSIDMAKMLLSASETYKVPSLKQSCFDYLQNVISIDTIPDILTLAYEYGGSELQNACADFVRKNSIAMYASKDWKEKLRSQPEVIARLIERVAEEAPQVENVSCITQSAEMTFSLKWTICGFSKCQLNSKEFLEGPSFYHSDVKHLSFKLELYPKGRELEDSDYISLRIIPGFATQSYITTGDITFGIINDKYRLENIFTFSLDRTHGRDGFIETNELFRNKHLLTNDSLTIYCKVHIILKNITHADNTTPAVQVPARLVSLSKDLEKLFESKYLSDVTLKLSEVEFKAHRSVLAARSSVFDAMFKSNMREKNSGVVQISESDSEVFKVFLRYLYTAELPPLTFPLAKSLLIISDKYIVLCLKSECADYLKSILWVGNVSEIVLLADMHDEPELKKAGMDLIRRNCDFVTDWKETFSVRPDLLTELLEETMKQEEN